jgi:dihydropyrimidinase
LDHAKTQLIGAGRVRPRDHAASHPRIAEIDAVERMCRFAAYLDQPVMLFHISTVESAKAVKKARGKGAPVWAETCPHYLFITEDILDAAGSAWTKWMFSLPQRHIADQAALWAALDEGDLQIVSSDQAPYRYDKSGKLKAGPNPAFHEVANCLLGLETRLPLMFDAMTRMGGHGPEQFAQITATAPAQIYGLRQKGAISHGMDADITIWDPIKQLTYGANDLSNNLGFKFVAGAHDYGLAHTGFLAWKNVMQRRHVSCSCWARSIDRSA